MTKLARGGRRETGASQGKEARKKEEKDGRKELTKATESDKITFAPLGACTL